jgi:hypothetical protein
MANAKGIINKRVIGTKGNLVTFEIEGIGETIDKLQNYKTMIIDQTNVGIAQAANLISNEVKESISGNRGEPKSVDTGNFINSIQIIPLSNMEVEVVTYVEYAKFLEFGTAKEIAARLHFTNTLNRNADYIKSYVFELIQSAKDKV